MQLKRGQKEALEETINDYHTSKRMTTENRRHRLKGSPVRRTENRSPDNETLGRCEIDLQREVAHKTIRSDNSGDERTTEKFGLEQSPIIIPPEAVSAKDDVTAARSSENIQTEQKATAEHLGSGFDSRIDLSQSQSSDPITKYSSQTIDLLTMKKATGLNDNEKTNLAEDTISKEHLGGERETEKLGLKQSSIIIPPERVARSSENVQIEQNATAEHGGSGYDSRIDLSQSQRSDPITKCSSQTIDLVTMERATGRNDNEKINVAEDTISKEPWTLPSSKRRNLDFIQSRGTDNVSTLKIFGPLNEETDTNPVLKIADDSASNELDGKVQTGVVNLSKELNAELVKRETEKSEAFRLECKERRIGPSTDNVENNPVSKTVTQSKSTGPDDKGQIVSVTQSKGNNNLSKKVTEIDQAIRLKYDETLDVLKDEREKRLAQSDIKKDTRIISSSNDEAARFDSVKVVDLSQHSQEEKRALVSKESKVLLTENEGNKFVAKGKQAMKILGLEKIKVERLKTIPPGFSKMQESLKVGALNQLETDTPDALSSESAFTDFRKNEREKGDKDQPKAGLFTHHDVLTIGPTSRFSEQSEVATSGEIDLSQTLKSKDVVLKGLPDELGYSQAWSLGDSQHVNYRRCSTVDGSNLSLTIPLSTSSPVVSPALSPAASPTVHSMMSEEVDVISDKSNEFNKKGQQLSSMKFNNITPTSYSTAGSSSGFRHTPSSQHSSSIATIPRMKSTKTMLSMEGPPPGFLSPISVQTASVASQSVESAKSLSTTRSVNRSGAAIGRHQSKIHYSNTRGNEISSFSDTTDTTFIDKSEEEQSSWTTFNKGRDTQTRVRNWQSDKSSSGFIPSLTSASSYSSDSFAGSRQGYDFNNLGFGNRSRGRDKIAFESAAAQKSKDSYAFGNRSHGLGKKSGFESGASQQSRDSHGSMNSNTERLPHRSLSFASSPRYRSSGQGKTSGFESAASQQSRDSYGSINSNTERFPNRSQSFTASPRQYSRYITNASIDDDIKKSMSRSSTLPSDLPSDEYVPHHSPHPSESPHSIKRIGGLSLFSPDLSQDSGNSSYLSRIQEQRALVLPPPLTDIVENNQKILPKHEDSANEYDTSDYDIEDESFLDEDNRAGLGSSSSISRLQVSPKTKKREWLLRMNRKLADVPVGELDPSSFPIAAIMNAWARTKSIEGATMVETWLNRVQLEVKAGNCRPGIQLTMRMYTMAVDAWAKSGDGAKAAHHAEAILQHMNQMYQANPSRNASLKPATEIFNAVLNSWARSKERMAAARAEQILNWMDSLYMRGNLDVQPDKYSYNTVIHAYAKRGGKDSAAKAQRLLDNMYRIYKEGNIAAKPDTVTYNICINAWAKSGDKGAAIVAQKLLSKMHRLYKMGDIDVKPNVVTYGAVIDAYAKSADKGAAAQGDKLLADMIERYQSNPIENVDLKPNTHVFNTVINCWAKTKGKDAASKAEEMLVAMGRLQENGIPNLKPDAVTYTAVIDAWAKSGNRGSASRAEELLNRMESKYLAGDLDLKPNTYTYNAVINSLAKSGEAGAAERAERVLQNMVNRHKTGGSNDVKPTTVHFNAVLDAWAKSKGGRSAADRTEEIIEWMDRLNKSGNTDVKPDTITFNACIDAWARSNDRRAPGRAEQILRHMDQLHAAGKDGIKPDSYTYNTVINAWAKSGEKGAAKKAEHLLSIMEEKYQGGDDSLKPNTRSYTSTIDAWAKSNEQNAAKKAEQILIAMLDQYERTGDTTAKPNAHTANAVMNACAFTRIEADKPSALSIAFRVFEWLIAQDGIHPDAYTFTIMLSVCSNLLPRQDRETRFSHARVLFSKCCDAGYVNEYVLRKLHQTVTEEEYLSLLNYRVNASVQNLPSKWTRNVNLNRSFSSKQPRKGSNRNRRKNR